MSAPAQESVAFAIRAPLRREDLPGLCERVCALLPRSPGGTAFCDVSGIAADCVAVDGLARLQLAACRRRCTVRLRNASDELLELVELMGLSEVLAE
jgi:ABC-type transporter Mla MlaB component